MRQRVWTVLALAGALCGCASGPLPGLIHRGETVSVRVTQPPSTEPIAIKNGAMGKGLGRGAAAGGLAGGLWGLACGPFAVLCVPVGAGIGALTGTASGAVVGAAGALSSERAALVRSRWDAAQETRPLADDLRARITEQAARTWKLGAEPAAVSVDFEVRTVSLTSTRDVQIGLYVGVAATVRRAGDPPGTAPEERFFEFEAEPIRFDTWMDPQGAYLDTLLTNCSQQLAGRIVGELTRE